MKLDKSYISKLIKNLESELVERTISVTDTDKYAKAICAFSNDLAATNQKGYLLIGVHDNVEHRFKTLRPSNYKLWAFLALKKLVSGIIRT